MTDSAQENSTPDTSEVAQRSARPATRFLRWSLSGCFVALLLVAAYFGGRNAGYDAGREAGFQDGHPEGYDLSLKALGFAQGFQHDYYVGDLLDARIGTLPRGEEGQRRIDAELQAIVEEIYAEVEPDVWNRPEDEGYRIEPSGANLTLTVRAKPLLVAAVGKWLKAEEARKAPTAAEEG